MEAHTPIKKLNQRWEQLTQERSSWIPHWQELSDYLLPRSGRYFTQDRNRGEKRHNKIYDSTGTRALRTLAAGMMSNMTSPARPWFRLTSSNPDLDESMAVKVWMAEVTRLMQMVFNKSNTYRSLHSMYEELGCFGTAAGIILPNPSAIIHHHTLTAGEYAIATDHEGRVNTLFREFEMTVAQTVREFGVNKVSSTVKNMFDRGNLGGWVPVMHAIEPREDRDASKKDSKNMPFKSVYFESGSDETKLLRNSGFKKFPALVPRWGLSGGDIYGNSPGMEVLGDVKQLQHEQLSKAKAINFKVDPALQAPVGVQVDTLPGGITFVAPGSQASVKTAFDVQLDLSHLLEDIQDVRQRINGGFYADLFMMMANDQRSGITATEVAERHEEKMLMLGPVVERLHNEILDPLIDITFDHMVAANIIPPAPEELQGMELSVEFVSVLAQAQRAVATNGVDRFVGNMGAMAQFKPEVLDKFDSDKWADTYADMLGVDPNLIVAQDKVDALRMQRAQAQAQAVQAEAQAQRAATVKDLAAAKTSDQSALTSVMDATTGYT
jgi:hypothetical protein